MTELSSLIKGLFWLIRSLHGRPGLETIQPWPGGNPEGDLPL